MYKKYLKKSEKNTPKNTPKNTSKKQYKNMRFTQFLKTIKNSSNFKKKSLLELYFIRVNKDSIVGHSTKSKKR